MSPVRGPITRALLVGAALLSAITSTAKAMPGGAPGSDTGDGSTPFTGLASAPEANLFVGSASSSISIQLPPARKAMTPRLALTYNSTGGQTPYGYGWDLALGSVQRSTKHGVLRCNDPTHHDEFVVNMPGSSTECTLPDSGSVRTCTPLVEEAFARIEYVQSGNRWEVVDRSGVRYTFGDVAAARTGSNNTQIFADPNPDPMDPNETANLDCSYTFSWGLTKVEDPYGNWIGITYKDDLDFLVDGVLYPEKIEYGGNTNVSGTDGGHKFEVSFQWGEEDVGSIGWLNGLGGFTAEITHLLSEIHVRYLVEGRTVRKYEFEHSTALGGPALLESATLSVPDPNNPASSIPLQGAGGVAGTTLIYQSNEPLGGDPPVPQQPGFGPGQLDETYLPVTDPSFIRRGDEFPAGSENHNIVREIMDMNADGIPDLVEASECGTWRVYRGSKRGFDTTAVDWNAPPVSGCLPIARTIGGGEDEDTYILTVDLNGDAIPDWIDASDGVTWKVLFGKITSGLTGWGFEDADPQTPGPQAHIWPALGYVPGYAPALPGVRRQSVISNGMVYLFGNAIQLASKTTRDLIDMNGDGLPDIVEPGACPHPTGYDPGYYVYWNNGGSGFQQYPSCIYAGHGQISISQLGTAASRQLVGLLDINGDGLPDEVLVDKWSYQGHWIVYLNTGSRMVGPYNWNAPALDSNSEISRSSSNQTHRDLFDINGDGLPDIVDVTGWTESSPNWTVFLNTGAGFEQNPISWQSPLAWIRDTVWWYRSRDVFDFDGDGLVDVVSFDDFCPDPPDPLNPCIPPPNNPEGMKIYRNLAGAWCGSEDETNCESVDFAVGIADIADQEENSRPYLLRQSQNGIGASTFVDYRPSTEFQQTDPPQMPFVSWNVTRIEHTDGLCNSSGCIGAGGSHSTETKIKYAYGKYHPQTKEFRGFATVEQEDGRGALRTTTFYQDQARKGKAWVTRVFEAGPNPLENIVSATFDTWLCASPTTGSSMSCDDALAAPAWVRRSSTSKVDYSNFQTTGYKSTNSFNLEWHQCGSSFTGNVKKSQSYGTNTATVTTRADYKCDLTAHILDKPTWIRTENDAVPPQALEEMWHQYDAKGSPVQTESLIAPYSAFLDPGWCTQDSSRRCNLTTMEYDPFGNLVTVKDDLGRYTDTAYDAATNLYPYIVTTARGTPLERKVGSGYDPACGVQRWQTLPYTTAMNSTPPEDSSHRKSQTFYDTFCRPIETVGPTDNPLTNPRQVFVYFLGGHPSGGGLPVPTRIRVSTKEPNHHSWYFSAWTITDSMGRLIQKQDDAVIDGTFTRVASTTVSYDEVGHPTVAYPPFSVAAGGVLQTPPATPYMQSWFDVLGRVTKVRNVDGHERQSDYSIAWQTTTTDECYNAAACDGGKTVEIRNGQGNVVEKQWHDEASGGDALKAKSKYTYDGMGRLLTSEQWDGAGWNPNTRITTTYDTLGRKKSVVDPNSGASGGAGVWTYIYDAVGNLRVLEDPKTGQHLQFCYDDLNRMTRKYVRATTDFSGAFTSCTFTGYDPATTTVYNYDGGPGSFRLGKLTSVADPSGATFLLHDARGNVTETTKSIKHIDGTVRNMTFRNTYDDADHVMTIRYPDGEIVDYDYDELGRVTHAGGTIGASYTDYLTSMTYDIYGRPRVAQHGNGVSDTRTYDPPALSSRLSSIQVTTASQTLLDYGYASYSPTGLLTSLVDNRAASGSYPGYMSAAKNYTYDGLGRLKTAVHPDMSGLTYNYNVDALGNLDHKEGVDFLFGNPAKPHQVVFMANQLVGHDDNGNRENRPGAHDDTYDYDAENRLIRITAAQETVEFLYDYTGTRVRKSIGTGPTASADLYFGELLELRGPGTQTMVKNYFAGGMRIATRHVTPWTLAQVPGSDDTMLARLSEWLDPASMKKGAMLAFGVGFVAIVIVPGRRRRVVGIAVRRGHLLGLTLIFFTATTLGSGVFFGVGPALAGGGGGGGGGPTPTPSGTAVDDIYHYHLDRLGSTHLVTSETGGVVEQIRYRPYGDSVGRYNASHAPISADFSYEFTGYETERHSGLQYAGARFYDPKMAMFLTHDPAGEFPNPYTYVNWDPINVTDPTGACALACLVIIGVIAGFAGSAINAAANGATWEKTLAAGAIGGAIGGVGAFVGSTVVAPVLGEIAGGLVTPVLKAAGVAEAGIVAENIVFGSAFLGSAGQAGYGLSQGDISGVISLGLSIGILHAWSQAGAEPEPSSKMRHLRDRAFGVDNNGPGGSPGVQVAQTMTDVANGTAVVEGDDILWRGNARTDVEIEPSDLSPGGVLRAGRLGVKAAREGAEWTTKVIRRSVPGRDGGSSQHVIEMLDGTTNSVTHQVTKGGQVIHQHQTHIGKHGTRHDFPDEWIEFPKVPGQ